MESVSIDTVSHLEKESVRRGTQTRSVRWTVWCVSVKGVSVERGRERMSVRECPEIVCLSREGVMSVQ